MARRTCRPLRGALDYLMPSTLLATESDALLVAAAVERYGTQKGAAAALNVSQPRLSRASIPGKGRALSARLRTILGAAVGRGGA